MRKITKSIGLPLLPYRPKELVYILRVVVRISGVKKEDIQGPSRKKKIKVARHIYCYLADKYTRNSLKNIGKIIGDRHYSTIIKAIDNIHNAIEFDYEDITRILKKAEACVRVKYKVKRREAA